LKLPSLALTRNTSKQHSAPKLIFFVELAASYSLPGLAEIAQTTLSALKQHPDKVIEIAQVAINDFKQACCHQRRRSHPGWEVF
jgi:hypothetical protein